MRSLNSWVVESWVFDFKYWFWKSFSRVFPYRAYVSHKNDSPNLTHKVWSIKGMVGNLSFMFLVVSILWKATSVQRSYLPAICRFCFLKPIGHAQRQDWRLTFYRDGQIFCILKETSLCVLEGWGVRFQFALKPGQKIFLRIDVRHVNLFIGKNSTPSTM